MTLESGGRWSRGHQSWRCRWSSGRNTIGAMDAGPMQRASAGQSRHSPARLTAAPNLGAYWRSKGLAGGDPGTKVPKRGPGPHRRNQAAQIAPLHSLHHPRLFKISLSDLSMPIHGFRKGYARERVRTCADHGHEKSILIDHLNNVPGH